MNQERENKIHDMASSLMNSYQLAIGRVAAPSYYDCVERATVMYDRAIKNGTNPIDELDE